MEPIGILLVGIATVFLLIIWLRINAFIALITAGLVVGISSPQVQLDAAMVETARIFGETAGKIGIVIALAAIIGQCLMESGAADKITRRIVGILGERYSFLSMLASGYILSIPVFFDTVFYLLIPVARALRVRTGKNYLLYVMAMCAGGAVTHSLVPPTPGPVAVASELGLDLGIVILMGLTIGLPASFAGWLYGVYMDRKLNIELREAPGLSMEELKKLAFKPDHELPGFVVSMLPIALPIFLITSKTIVDATDEGSRLAEITGFLGNPNFALLISTAAALTILMRQKRYTMAQLARPVETGLASGGIIILITSAGGAFGGMLKLAGVGDMLQGFSEQFGVSVLWLGFLLAVLFKIAQGSGTVAMITSAAITVQLIEGASLPFHPVYVAMAIGGGSKIGSWMNDSGFWVVKQMSGMTEVETLKTWTVMLSLMGVVTFAITLLLSWIFPLV